MGITSVFDSLWHLYFNQGDFFHRDHCKHKLYINSYCDKGSCPAAPDNKLIKFSCDHNKSLFTVNRALLFKGRNAITVIHFTVILTYSVSLQLALWSEKINQSTHYIICKWNLESHIFESGIRNVVISSSPKTQNNFQLTVMLLECSA